MSKEDDLIIGVSKSICKIRELVTVLSNTDVTVLLSGESGTGKTLAAMAIHQMSRRRNKSLLHFDCAATSEKFLEMELFGVEKSLEEGGVKSGLLDSANGCNVLFENIDCLPIKMQVSLLRVFQEQKFIRSRGKVSHSIDARFMATSQRDLIEKVEAKLFREDFYYRLNVIPIHMPSLRDRPDDIEPLLREFATRMQKDANSFLTDVRSHGLLPYLHQYSWPGNVKELRQVVETLILTEDWESIKPLLSRQNSGPRNAKPEQGGSQTGSVFISYCSQDRHFAKKLSSDLRLFGVRVWIDEGEIKVGDSLIEKIRQGIDQVDYLAVVLTPASANSEWVKKEVD
ncbi:MAG: sigma 54-interacting transcriptional regulator, partial [Desulfobacterales bacterium]|nr:sigma 54-interacting transcriptional regulator [Desulfobacterales bacterium]